MPTDEELKRAFKAFKKRLKLTRLDDESRLGRSPLTGGGTLTLTGSNTYAASGDFTITVSVTFDGVTVDAGVPIEVDVQQVTVPCTGSCSGTVADPLQSATGSTTSTTGSLFLSLEDGTFNCGSGYEYAPQVTTVPAVGVPATKKVDVKVTFLRSLLQGTPGLPVGVCFASNHPFIGLDNVQATATLINGQTYYVGLLKYCTSIRPDKYSPCVGRVVIPHQGNRIMTENIRFPAGDPKFR